MPADYYLVYRKVASTKNTSSKNEYLLDENGQVRKFGTRRSILRAFGVDTESNLNAFGMYISKEIRK